MNHITVQYAANLGKYVTAKTFVENLPETGLKNVYIAGCNSMPFAEEVKKLRPDLKVFGIAVTKDFKEGTRGETYFLRQKDKSTGVLEEIEFKEAKAPPKEPAISKDLL